MKAHVDVEVVAVEQNDVVTVMIELRARHSQAMCRVHMRALLPTHAAERAGSARPTFAA